MKPGLIRSGPPPLTGLAFWLAAVFLVLVWGTAFTMVDVAVRYLPPIWVVALANNHWQQFWCWLTPFIQGPPIAADHGCALALVYISGRHGHGPAVFSDRLGAGNAGKRSCRRYWSGIMPLMTLVLAHFFTAEKMNARKIIGFVIGFIGTIILFLPEDFSWGLVSDWRAQSLALMAALGYAITTVAAKRAPETPSSLGAAMMVSAAAVISLAMALISGVPSFDVPPLTWLMIAGLAIGSTGIATIVYLLVIDRNGPTTLAKINYFPPFASVIAGIFFLE